MTITCKAFSFFTNSPALGFLFNLSIYFHCHTEDTCREISYRSHDQRKTLSTM